MRACFPDIFITFYDGILAARVLYPAVHRAHTYAHRPAVFPKNGCTLNNTNVAKCNFFCEASQKWTCDECHPDNAGYTEMAATMMAGIGL